ncbi:hypothetical protein AMJ96_CH00598 [Rhizobium sp. N113]|uniref:hypothetical protein n=1 Tax=Rhizobium TaxID=379 RepID=UPI0007EB5711|nr:MULTISPECIES: hypothetical protein [Rhizobium]ANL02189.1 hypothetical protein AMJ99_CH00594 [Rhizobium esperanzae]ANL08317.1 hypothetical protein AMJ98_CH00594 [Rhizobium sp. N1341]ANL20366.1 hypothetical protein AMJ96_CH00598 [Rhizobium sp. N113]ANM33040.1 hypothetical protein AMK04_CH00594 [Rhizobium sp. N871]ANM39158.1 hypothetical protein AMK03_CH00594 [Rhizobium sp. N741]
MQDDHNQTGSEIASTSVSRRFFLRSAAATAALAVPVAAAADEETALEKLERLMAEASAAREEYQNGTFSAVIHPASTAERPISLEKRPATLDEKVDRCVSALKRLLVQMHPDATVTAFRCIREDDQDRSIIFNVCHHRPLPRRIEGTAFIDGKHAEAST